MLLCNVLLSAYRADGAPFVAAAPSEAVSCLLSQGAVYRCSPLQRTNRGAKFEVGSAEEEEKQTQSLVDVEGTTSL